MKLRLFSIAMLLSFLSLNSCMLNWRQTRPEAYTIEDIKSGNYKLTGSCEQGCKASDLAGKWEGRFFWDEIEFIDYIEISLNGSAVDIVESLFMSTYVEINKGSKLIDQEINGYIYFDQGTIQINLNKINMTFVSEKYHDRTEKKEIICTEEPNDLCEEGFYYTYETYLDQEGKRFLVLYKQKQNSKTLYDLFETKVLKEAKIKN